MKPYCISFSFDRNCYISRRWVNVPKTADPFQRSLVTLTTTSGGVADWPVASPAVTTKKYTSANIEWSESGTSAAAKQYPAAPKLEAVPATAKSHTSDSSYAESMARVDQWLTDNSATTAAASTDKMPASAAAAAAKKRPDPVLLDSSLSGGILTVAKEDVVKGVVMKGTVAPLLLPPPTGETKRKAPKPPAATANRKKFSIKSKKR